MKSAVVDEKSLTSRYSVLPQSFYMEIQGPNTFGMRKMVSYWPPKLTQVSN